MKINKISKENATFQELLAIKSNRTKRTKLGCFFVEGVQNINNVLLCGWQIEKLFFSNYANLSNWAKDVIKKVKCPLFELESSLMEKVSGKDDASEIVAIVKMKDFDITSIRCNNPVVLLLDRPSKKGNLGTIIRSAEAFGVDLILYSGHSVDIYDPQVITTSMGSFFKVPFKFISSNQQFESVVKQLKQKYNISVVGTSLQTENSLTNTKLVPPILLMVGNEAEGLNKTYRAMCEKFVKIDMRPGIDSLNVACATSICLYEISKFKLK